MKAKRILVPVDFGANQGKAMELATTLARDTGAKLYIVHVEEPVVVTSVGGSSYAEPAAASVEHKDETIQLLRQAVPTAADVECEHHILSGWPADAIVEYADKIHADSIVMSTHGRTGISRVLMGSVAEAVVRRASCPVITLKDQVDEAEEE